MAGIGEASAILGVAQLGLQLAQTLVTVIGDYRDAAVNINRLRDEVNLASICLQQLGELAKQGRLIAGRGVLEATNLRERCRAVIWQIRTVIRKGDNPLHPEEITKEDIDVTYFTAWKWALWTKKHLEEPRAELDRLKDSMTLTFVTHMAILATSEAERRRYEAQIPGYWRSCRWAEERYRSSGEFPPDGNGNDSDGDGDGEGQDAVPAEVLNAGPDEWRDFVKWKNAQDKPLIELQSLKQRLQDRGISQDQITAVLGISGQRDVDLHTTPPTQPYRPKEEPKAEEEVQAWSLDPFVGRVQMPVTQDWLRQVTVHAQRSEELWTIYSKLQAWYKKQVEELVDDLSADGNTWTLFSLKLVQRSWFRRIGNPPSLQVIVKRSVGVGNGLGQAATGMALARTDRIAQEQEVIVPIETVNLGVQYRMIAKRPDTEAYLTDEELIQRQLDLYKS
ncbi:hypothetical protein DV736_g3203, partial [Chaetothyriales sp. CBS 134916]